MNKNISKTMQEVILKMQKHGDLKRVCGNDFWTYEGCSTLGEHYHKSDKFYRYIPKWSCSINTLRALHSRGMVELDEDNKVCKLVN